MILFKNGHCQDSSYIKTVDSLTAGIDKSCRILKYKTMIVKDPDRNWNYAIEKFIVDSPKQLLYKVEFYQFSSDTAPISHSFRDGPKYKVTTHTENYVFYYNNNELIKVADLELKTDYYVKGNSAFLNVKKNEMFVLDFNRFTIRNIQSYNKKFLLYFYRSL